ncbi:MAG: phospholipase D-like domain-containing protein [Nanoarchaeota archaeon]
MRYLACVPLLLLLSSCAYQEMEVSVCFTGQKNCSRFIDGFHQAQCAFYDLDTQFFQNHVAGSQVLLFEKNYQGFEDVQDVEPVDSRGLMHHKFCVQGQEVWVGSMNPTENGMYRNDNNVLVLRDSHLADYYRSILVHLHNRSKAVEKAGRSSYVEAMMCQQTCRDRIIWEIRNARSSVHFMIFTFTDMSTAVALLDAHARGISVEGVVEKRSASHTIRDLLAYQGLDVEYDSNPAVMHHKVFIIDNRTVITGSYNPTKSAEERNDENIIVLKSERIAREYLEEYRRVSGN